MVKRAKRDVSVSQSGNIVAFYSVHFDLQVALMSPANITNGLNSSVSDMKKIQINGSTVDAAYIDSIVAQEIIDGKYIHAIFNKKIAFITVYHTCLAIT